MIIYDKFFFLTERWKIYKNIQLKKQIIIGILILFFLENLQNCKPKKRVL